MCGGTQQVQLRGGAAERTRAGRAAALLSRRPPPLGLGPARRLLRERVAQGERGGGEAECELRAVLRQPACLRDRLKLGHLLTLAAVDSAPCSPLTAPKLSAGSSRSSWEVRGGGWAVASAAPRIA